MERNVRFDVMLVNQTSKMEMKADSQIELIELFGRGVVLDVPENLCANGHDLYFKITPIGVRGAKPFEASGVILDYKRLPGKRARIEVSYIQVSQDDVREFLSYFSQAQTQITELLEKMKG